ncbi:membrane progestin receptor alpha isoform X2 [Motacilla alba alba]|uniref:membrane progestin receptor alpha isoform X2 n=1 Tax=Motacilla alba alba TaxID=1094192 RepID=UPI0018D562CF|nr:membrane progestin receptor alpha isoform X2 [Motacilla alba alba]
MQRQGPALYPRGPDGHGPAPESAGRGGAGAVGSRSTGSGLGTGGCGCPAVDLGKRGDTSSTGAGTALRGPRRHRPLYMAGLCGRGLITYIAPPSPPIGPSLREARAQRALEAGPAGAGKRDREKTGTGSGERERTRKTGTGETPEPEAGNGSGPGKAGTGNRAQARSRAAPGSPGMRRRRGGGAAPAEACGVWLDTAELKRGPARPPGARAAPSRQSPAPRARQSTMARFLRAPPDGGDKENRGPAAPPARPLRILALPPLQGAREQPPGAQQGLRGTARAGQTPQEPLELRGSLSVGLGGAARGTAGAGTEPGSLLEKRPRGAGKHSPGAQLLLGQTLLGLGTQTLPRGLLPAGFAALPRARGRLSPSGSAARSWQGPAGSSSARAARGAGSLPTGTGPGPAPPGPAPAPPGPAPAPPGPAPAPPGPAPAPGSPQSRALSSCSRRTRKGTGSLSTGE